MAHPVSPIVPGLNLPEVVYAKNQPEYIQLPVFKQEEDGLILCRWKLSWKERILSLLTGNVYLEVLTFNHPLQPLKLYVEKPQFEDKYLTTKPIISSYTSTLTKEQSS